MKEKIIEIIQRNVVDGYFGTYIKSEEISEEITAMVFEFVGWIRERDTWYLHDLGLHTNTQCFNYWLTNIYKK
jgi:hypothetical protein